MEGTKDRGQKLIFSKNKAYNTSEKIVIDRLGKDIPLKLIKSFLIPEIIRDIPKLAFVHLNTGDLMQKLNL
tara:strand:- start:1013 stop:1225 length:213 start_codon:yes stop_codon:yes gene_type:complete